MSAISTGPGRPRSLESEQAILDCTLELLAERGFSGLTLDAVAARARCSKATIYRRWASKLHLAIAAFAQTPELPDPDTGDLRRDLRSVIDAFLRILRSTPLAGVLPSLIGERSRNPELSEALSPLIDQRRVPIQHALERATARGELPPDLDLDLAADVVMGPLVTRIFFVGRAPNRAYVDRSLDIALRGLGWNA